MRKDLIRIGTALAGLTAAVLGLGACAAESTPSIVITNFHHLEVEDDACSWTEDPYLGGAFYADVSALNGDAFTAYLRIENAMPPNDDDDGGRVNTTFVQLTSFEVKFANKGEWAFLPAKRLVPTGFVMKSESENFVPVNAIDSAIAKLMIEDSATPIPAGGDCADLLLTFKAKGIMGDGSDIESNEIDYPVTVCRIFEDPVAAGLNVCGAGFVPKGCSIVQPDGYTCEEVEAPATP